MAKLHQTIGCLLVAIWLPAVSWCLLESSGWIPTFGCCAETAATCPEESSEKDENRATCCFLRSGHYKPDRFCFLAIQPVVPSLIDQPEIIPTLVRVTISPVLSVPEELICGWQFDRRTAGSSRAPDFAV